ncbi:hypothetical protein ABK905_04040 [Acerihabitans sp. KWT182]|uniref:MutL C-terminal dimerisation domain-containing protein n=1 Tax=Acerihabitans sp. KWT182 TaxID=3157919 RepID=A0AAU7QF75_9GAMM
MEFRRRLALISLPAAERCLKRQQLTPDGENLRAQPLLIPLRITLSEGEAAAFRRHQPLLAQMGIQLQINQRQGVLNGVPLPLRQQNLQNLIPELLGYLANTETITCGEVAAWMARRLEGQQHVWSLSQAIQLLAEVERLCPQWVKSPPGDLLVLLDLEAAIEALNHD